jgi:hypothetical protein
MDQLMQSLMFIELKPEFLTFRVIMEIKRTWENVNR